MSTEMTTTKKKNEVAKAPDAPAPAEGPQFLALQEGSAVAEALEANVASGEQIEISDLTTVSVPSGGSTVWQFEDVDGDVTTEELRGLMVYYGAAGTLWPSEEPGDAMPVLVTHDMKKAYRVGDDLGDIDPKILEKCRNEDGSYDWLKLPYNQFGSSSKGRGKRCKDQRMVCLLREGDTFPLLVRVPPASLKGVTKFVKKLNVPFFQCVVAMTLSKEKNKAGQPYAEIRIRRVGVVDRETGLKAKSLYADALGEAIRAIAVSRPETTDQDDLE